ncbi:MAG: N-acyl homoserine lactonase family protein [Pseudolabrys sp.]|nr:N-acyl homoserine lactonase family protein [Pseudolabrys sp.]
MESIEPYEIFALHYGINDRPANLNFLGGDPHEQGSMPLYFYIWLVRNSKRTIVFDTGFDRAVGEKRGRNVLRDPAVMLSALGVQPDSIKDVVLSHMHYDHAGNRDLFPHARYHVQDKELAFCTGRCMCHKMIRYPYEVDDVSAMVRRVFDGRVKFHDGTDEIAPGITVHHIGGHTAGLQSMRVWTQRGWVVLASDALHYRENMKRGQPFPVFFELGPLLEGYETLRKLASSDEHIIPGHDGSTLQIYPQFDSRAPGIVRLDVSPAADR